MIKICIKCDVEKALERFPFEKRRQKHTNVCKDCLNAVLRSRKEKYSKAKKAYAEKVKANPELLKKSREAKARYSKSEQGRKKLSEWIARNYNHHRAIKNQSLAHYKAKKKLAAVSWANKSKILDIYARAKRMELWLGIKFDVDHIVPIVSDIVCGLHCEANLQIIPTKENQIKGNRYWEDMP